MSAVQIQFSGLARRSPTRWTVNVVDSSERPTVGNVWLSGVTPCGGGRDD